MAVKQHLPTNATSGDFADEQAAADRVDSMLEMIDGLFDIRREVRGSFVEHNEVVAVRIDRILVPRRAAIDGGWSHGPIGIEIKRSQANAGRLFVQSEDYAKAIYESNLTGVFFRLGCVFVFPPVEQKTPFHTSVMAQRRVGELIPYNRGGFGFQFATTAMLTVDADGGVIIGTSVLLRSGRKHGSR